MTAIDFSTLPMAQKAFTIHFRQKIENTKWLGRLFDYCQRGNNESGKKFKAKAIPPTITEPFTSFPYRWDVKRSTMKLTPLGKPIVEDHTEFDPDETTFIVSLPFHNPSVDEISRIVTSIENQSFGKTKKTSKALVQTRVAVVIGLNNCLSFNPEKNGEFKNQVESLRKKKLASYVSLTIIPFFWGHVWMSKSAKELKLKKLISSHIHPIQGCYRIANSYFRCLRKNAENLWIDDQFKQGGSPLEKTIPYQAIRNKILHSVELKRYFESSESEAKYILSLDGDFLSLKAADSSKGLLTHYDAIVEDYNEENGSYPDVVSTGYESPKKEKNELIKEGIELDRAIRAAIPAKFVYMPEPNFGFRVTKVTDLSRLSWTGGTTMDTESRRLIESGVERKILDSDSFVYRNRGGIQTEIDAAWRTATVNKYPKMLPAHFLQKAAQKALRGIHQSYADPQIWAKNVYTGLGVTVSSYIKDAIAPMKGIRELFDPITMCNVRYDASLKIPISGYKALFESFPAYVECMRVVSNEDFDQLTKEFVQNAKISGKYEKEYWSNFMLGQLEKLKDYRELLEENYSTEQVDEVIEAAIATGKAIKNFYKKRITAKNVASAA
jgi:hypothetical protein